jgi:hypothetical protein
MLHPRGPGDPKLSPASDLASSSSEDSSMVVRREGDLLWTITMNVAPESHS